VNQYPQYSKNHAERGLFVAASAANFWKRDISSASERAFPGGLAIFLVAQLPPKKGVLVHKNSLASYQRCSHSVEPCALMCPFKQSNLSAWSLLGWHPTHTYLWGRLCSIQVVCSPPSRSRRVTQVMSAEALLLNGFCHNPQKPTSTTHSIQSACALGSRRTKSLQTVATRVVPATASFYSARSIGTQASTGAAVDEELLQAGKTCCRHRASGFQASKSVGFRRGIPPAVHVFYKLFWNWNGFVRFVSQDKGFVIWHFHHYCLVQIVSLWSLNFGVRIIFTTNEFVNRIMNFKSNDSRFEKQIMKIMRRRPDFLWNKMRCRQDLSNKMRRRQDILTMVALSYWYSMYIIFHTSQHRIFFF